MFLKSSDPDGYAVIHDGVVYPVRGGVFLVSADERAKFPSFADAGEVPAEVSQELADLGSWPAEFAAPEPSAAVDDGQDGQEEPVEAVEAAESGEADGAADEPGEEPEAAVEAVEGQGEPVEAEKPKRQRARKPE